MPSFMLASNNVSIDTTSGLINATKSKNVLVFEDIPYAQAPIGNLRWKAPREVIEKLEIFPKDGNFCIQRPLSLIHI